MNRYSKISNVVAILVMSIFSLSACTEVPSKSSAVTGKVKEYNYPILTGKEDNPVARIKFEAQENDSVSSFSIDFGQTNLAYIESVRVYATQNDTVFDTSNLISESTIQSGTSMVTLEGLYPLSQGENNFWLSIELAPDVPISSEIDIEVLSAEVTTGEVDIETIEEHGTYRVGVAVRQHNDDGVHTYRIPGLTTTLSGTLLAVYDVRRDSRRDLQGDMDIGVSRSTDGGKTWEPMRIALDMGEWGDLPEKFNGVSDANILVDENTGNIFVAGLWMHGVINSDGVWVEGLTEESEEWNHQWRNKGSQAGYGVKETSQFLLTKSEDDGKTWSEPVNLTKMLKEPEWWLIAPGPGHGITLKDGTLVMPTQGRDENGHPFSNISYSKDGGETWKSSNPAYHNTTEAMAVELSDGSIMLNMRHNENREDKSDTNGRAIAVTYDLGETWTEHPTSRGALIEPTCMASIHRHDYVTENGEKKNILFFSNPNSKYKRHKQTIKVSLDDGQTWPEKYWIELDEGSGAGYSCLTSVDNDNIGILYESSQAHMTYQVLNLKDFFEEDELK